MSKTSRKTKASKTSEPSSDGNYEVGRGKTPKHSRYRPGQSGNPKGRKKGSRNYGTSVRKVLNQMVVSTRNGKSVRVTLFEVGLQKLIQSAFAGSARHMELFIKLAEKYLSGEPAENTTLSPSDESILDAFTESLKRNVANEVKALGKKAAADKTNDKLAAGGSVKRYRRRK